MTPSAIDQELMREPFVPLRIYDVNGRGYLVRTPGACTIMRGTLYIARIDRPRSRLLDDLDAVDCAHVRHIEHIDEPSATGGMPERG